MRRWFRFFAAFLATLLLLGSSNCSKNSDANAPQFVSTLSVEDTNGNLDSGFATGVTIQFVLSVRNRSNTAQTLFFNTTELCNFAVVDAGTTNVEWTDDNSSASTNCTGSAASSGFSQLDFTAGETKTFTTTWNQANDSGNQVAKGNYEVLGGVTVYNTSGAGSAADNGNSMAEGNPSASQMFPSVYRSVFLPFSVQ